MCCQKTFNTNKDVIEQTYQPLTVSVLDHIMHQAFTNNKEQNYKLYDTIKELNLIEKGRYN